MVRAKFVVSSITEHAYGDKHMKTVKMSPVSPKYEGGKVVPDAENSKFWDASPSGEMTLGTINMEAAAQFELGKPYYLDFTPAE